MLVIFFSFFGAGLLHANRRTSFSSVMATPSRACAPLGASRVPWRAPVVAGPHLHELLPHLALEWCEAPPPWATSGAVGDDYLRVAGCMHSSGCARSLPLAPRVSLQALTLAASSGPLVLPQQVKVEGELSYQWHTTTTSLLGEHLPVPSSHMLTVRLLGLRASQPRCGVVEDSFLFNIPCDVGLPLHNVAVVYTDTYASALLPSHSSTTSITSMQSSHVRGDGERGGGSWGSLAGMVWSCYIELFCAHNSSLALHHHSIFSGLQPPFAPHWLAHFDYDLQLRRRVEYAFVPYHSKAIWSGLVKEAVRFWTPIIYQAKLSFVFGAYSLAAVSVALESASSSNISVLVALISNSVFLWHLLGSERCSSLIVDPLCCIFNHLSVGTHLPLAHFTRVVPSLLFWTVVLSQVSCGSAVCLSCSGNDPNCQGGTNCVLAKALAANALVMAGTVGAAKAISMGDDGKHILPLTWLQFLKPSVLSTLVSLANRAPSGTPLDLTSLTIQALSTHISNGTVSISEGRLEFLRRMSADGVSDSDLLKMKTICEVLPAQRGEDRFQSPLSKLSNSGALQFVFALASQIVLRLAGSSKISVAIGESASSSAGLVSIELKRPQSSDAFFHSLTVWQTLLCATGLANVVVTGPFLSEVVHDIVPARGWKVALEHFILYIAKIDSGCGWQLASATTMGSHDTFMHKAIRAAGEDSKPLSVPTPKATPSEKPAGGEKKVVWNGRFNAESPRTCPAFNFGQDHKSLRPDGSCPFNHACDQWVSDKGKGGRCMLAHSRTACTNPAKSASKAE